MATKQKRAPTLKLIVRAGTPNEMTDTSTYSDPSQAKRFLISRIQTHKKWADAFSLSCAEQLGSIRAEINGLDPRSLHPGEVRSWEAEDAYSGVRFKFQIEMVSR